MSPLSEALNKIKVILSQHLYLLLIIPLFFIAYPIAKPGIPITGDFPYSDTSDYAINRLWLWVEKGSLDGLESLSRFPIIGLWYLLSFVNLNSELATKIMVVLGFLLASFSFYFSFLLFFKNKGIFSNIRLKLSALLGSIFYAYNIWSFNRIHHWYLWIGYAILPLFFISVYFSFKNPKNWKYIISSIFLWSIASTTPHMALYYGIIFLSTFLGFIFNDFYKRKKPTTKMILPFLVIILFYPLVNMYWIYPYLLVSRTQIPIVNYEVTEESLKLLSREGNFLDTFRIMSYWLNSIVEKPLESSSLYFLWVLLSFVVPIVAFSALLLKRMIKYALVFSGTALVGIFFAMGTQSGFDYYNLLLTVPLLSKFVWIFREPDKWSFLINFGYSFLIGLVSYTVLSITIKGKNYNNKKTVIASAFIFILILSICITSYPFYEHHMSVLKPTILPSEIDRVNSFLSRIDAERIYFMPYPMEETQWDQLGRVGSIYQFHSIKPSIESSEYNLISRNYYNHLANSVLDNRTKNISNSIYPLGTAYLIFHNDTWSKILRTYEPTNIELLNKMYSLGDLKNIANIGFYKIFHISNNNNSISNYTRIGEVNVPSQIVATIGGLDIYNSLNTVPSFNSLQSSLFFLDDIHTRALKNPARSLDQLLSDRSSLTDDFVLSQVDDKYISSPIVGTNNYNPSKVWSKSGSRDPVQAEFHPYLKNLGIENWEFDNGKGLVMTKAMGENLSFPIQIGKQNKVNDGNDNNYYLFIRYLKNQKGGLMKIYLDQKLISEIDTSDRISNKFTWGEMGLLNLTEGKHKLTLENVGGFNAVNILSIVPVDEMKRLKKEVNQSFDKAQVIYYLEAESNFYNNKGESTNSTQYLLENQNSSQYDIGENNTQTKTIKGSFTVPPNADLMTLQFIRGQNDSNSSLIHDLEISPANKKWDIFYSDYEQKKDSVPLATFRQFDWMNYDRDIASTSLETNRAIHGNNSLRVDLKESDKVGWNILSTDYIPIKDNRYYNASLDVSAGDVKDLHSRVIYFDEKKEEMSGAAEFIFEGKDGTFQDTFSDSILPPIGARYLKFQVLTKSDNSKASSFLLDNVKIEEIVIPDAVFKTKFDMNLAEDKDYQKQNSDYLDGAHKINSTHYMLVTKALPVKENLLYNYTANVKTGNVPKHSVIATFRNSGDVVENSTRYSNNASNGRVLSLSPGSEIETTLEILKPSNYTIAFRATTCQNCTFIRLVIDGNKYNNNFSALTNISSITLSNISLKDNISGLHWLASNPTYLKQGTYKIKIYSDSQTDLDSVVIYPGNTEHPTNTSKGHHETLDLFKEGSSPAQITGYEKINPTKHILSIKNATRPYIISLAESYDPLWTAYSNSDGSKKNNDFRTNSIPLYGVTNGFYVNKTGDYSLVIQYEPQKWFIQGAIISILSLLIISVGLFLVLKQKTIINLCAVVCRTLWHRTNKL